jgi:hypothetical protein
VLGWPVLFGLFFAYLAADRIAQSAVVMNMRADCVGALSPSVPVPGYGKYSN